MKYKHKSLILAKIKRGIRKSKFCFTKIKVVMFQRSNCDVDYTSELFYVLMNEILTRCGNRS